MKQSYNSATQNNTHVKLRSSAEDGSLLYFNDFHGKLSVQEVVNMSETYVKKINAFLAGGTVPVLSWQHLKDCLSEDQDLKQVTSLKRFGTVLKTRGHNAIPQVEKDLCGDILTQILVTIDPKTTLHRAVTSILQSFPDGDQEFLSGQLISALDGQLGSCPWSNTRQCRRCVDVISGLLDNFPLGEKSVSSVFEKVVVFLHKALQVFMETTSLIKDTISQNEAMHSCLAAVQTIIAVVPRCSPDKRLLGDAANNLQGMLEAILHTVWAILSNESYLADCRSAAGIALVLLLRSLLPRDGHQLSSSIYSALFCQLSAATSPPSPPAYRYDTASLPAQSYLFVCHGVLAMLDSKDLMDGRLPQDGHCLLLHVLFPEILTLTERLTEPSSALTASRTLTLWTAAAIVAMTSGAHGNCEVSLVGSAEISQKLIQYVWTNWDHPIDGIRYQTKNIFENVLKLHVIAKEATDYEPDDDPFLLGLLDSLVAVNWHVRGKYMPLGCLVTHLGAERILGLYPTMPWDLFGVFGDQTLAPYACDLLEKLFANHKSFLTRVGQDPKGLHRWQNTWILPLLEFLCSLSASRGQKTYLIDYCIPRLLKCSPETLEFIVAHLHKNDRGSSTSLDKPGQLGALVTCLKTARSMGLIKHDGKCESGEVASGASLWKGLVPYAKLKEALCHRESQVRIDALGLLCDCNRTTEAVSIRELALLQFFLVLNLNSPSPSFRQQMGTHLKKLFIRLRESGRVRLKQMSKRHRGKESPDTPQHSPDEDLIETYKDFMSWLTCLLFDALQPGSSYPCRTVALHTLKVMAQIFTSQAKGGKPLFFDVKTVWTPDHLQLLLHRLTDPYESNKVMAFDLLGDLPQQTLGLMDKELLHQFYRDALRLAASNKPHNCETASYMLRHLARQLVRPLVGDTAGLPQSLAGLLTDLCVKLAGEVGVAKGSLLEAAVQGPMYGALHCIRELLADVDLRSVGSDEGWGAMVTSLIKLCLDVADAASLVVCNSSPEGYIPDEPDDVSDFESGDQTSEQEVVPPSLQSSDTAGRTQKVTSQMVLVCCWRSMKEVSLLMGQLALSAPLCSDRVPTGLITRQQLEEIGRFFLKLLKESKHRGAFELAYAGFIVLTTRLWKSDVTSLHRLPQQWLQGLLTDITSSQSILCATRRSAGIPFAIQALVSSEPSTQGKRCFRQAMVTLLELAFPSSSDSEAVTSQVHSLNILRVLYKDTRLGEDVIPYVADGVRASVLGFAARLWAVRNSSTLLFSALVTRIFGVQRAKKDHDRRNCMTGKEFFARFPSLHPFLLQQLKEATSQNAQSGVAHLHPSLFPVLLLLSRLYPSPMDGAHTRLSMDLFVPHVLKCAHSAVFKTRAIAARALVPLIPANRQMTVLRDLIGLLPKTPDEPSQHNHIHGVLLQIHELLDCILELSVSKLELHKTLTEVLLSLADNIWLASTDNKCLVTRAAFLAILDASLFESSFSLQETSLSSLRTHAAALATTEIQTAPSTPTALCEPGSVMLQTTCANFSLRWIISCESVKASESSAAIVEEASKEEESEEMTTEANAGSEQMSDLVSSPGKQQSDCASVRGRCSSVRGHLPPSQDTVLVELLSSPIYEVRLLTLDHLIQSSQQRPSDRTAGCQPWATVAASRQVFQRLVAMVTEEEHEPCLMKVYELLSWHPMTRQFPWQLPGRQVTCMESFQAAIGVALQPKQREDIISSILRFTACLVSGIYSGLCSTDCDTVKRGCKLLSDWSLLLDQCSLADQTVHSRATVVNVIDQLAALVLLDHSACLGDIPFLLWGVVMRLLQDDDCDVQLGAVSCIRKVALKMEHSKVADLCLLDIQPSLGLHLGLQLFLTFFIHRQPAKCLQTLMEWGAGAGKEASSDGCQEAQDERLFDQGEANTNFEGVSLAKIICKQLYNLAKTTQVMLPSSAGRQSSHNLESIQEPVSEELARKEPYHCRSTLQTLQGDFLHSGFSQDERQVVFDLPAQASEQGSHLISGRMAEADPDLPSRREECITTGCTSSLRLSATVVHRLQNSARDCLADLTSRLEECLQQGLAPSAYLNAGEWETQCTGCCRVLLCCQALTELLPRGSDAGLAARLSPSLAEVRGRFCKDGGGSSSLLVKRPLQSLMLWCGLEGGS